MASPERGTRKACVPTGMRRKACPARLANSAIAAEDVLASILLTGSVMTSSHWTRGGLPLVLGFTLITPACAGPRRPPENAAAPRIKDSAPEKAAAMRAANSNLRLEEEDARWGITAAEERKRAREDQRRNTVDTSVGPTPTVKAAPVPKP